MRLLCFSDEGLVISPMRLTITPRETFHQQPSNFLCKLDRFFGQMLSEFFVKIPL